MAMISGCTPIFWRSFLSSITHIGLLVGLKPAHASRSLSWAKTLLPRLRDTAKTSIMIDSVLFTFTSSFWREQSYHFGSDQVKVSSLIDRLFRVFCKEVFTAEAPSSQRSENFLIKNSLLRVLRASAV